MIDLARVERYARLFDFGFIRPGSELYAGRHRSIFKGQGLAFAEFREYQYGDDIRSIAWNATTRLGKPFVKIFEQERGSTFLIVLDLSASLAIGSLADGKSAVARELAALFVCAAEFHNDRVGALLFTDHVEKFMVPRRGRSYGRTVVRTVARHEPTSKGTDISAALREAMRRMRRSGVVVVISDFMDDLYERPLKALAFRHDVLCIVLVDPADEALPQVGLIHYRDAETGVSRWIDASSRRVREAYLARCRALRDERHAKFARAGVAFVEIPVNQSYLPPLLYLTSRRRVLS